MAVVELSDRDLIATLLRRNASAHVYELGDLDDFDWPYTRWFGWDEAGRIEEVVLLYTQPSVPVLIAIAVEPSDTMEELLVALLPTLPSSLYVHVSPPLLEVFRARYGVDRAEPHLKLALACRDRLPAAAIPIELLAAGDLAAVEAFYRDAYPETWFTARMLATGRYVGVKRDGRLVCVAGVHVYSPMWRVAALGNVATLPELRGEGLAQGACAALCRLLLADGIETIALNVRSDNAAAIRAYTRLGFEPVTPYWEAALAVPAGI